MSKYNHWATYSTMDKRRIECRVKHGYPENYPITYLHGMAIDQWELIHTGRWRLEAYSEYQKFLQSIPFTEPSIGCYVWLCRANGRIYVGQGFMRKRVRAEYRALFIKGHHRNQEWLRDAALYGPHGFDLMFILCDDAKGYESMLLDSIDPSRLYNLQLN